MNTADEKQAYEYQRTVAAESARDEAAAAAPLLDCEKSFCLSDTGTNERTFSGTAAGRFLSLVRTFEFAGHSQPPDSPPVGQRAMPLDLPGFLTQELSAARKSRACWPAQ